MEDITISRYEYDRYKKLEFEYKLLRDKIVEEIDKSKLTYSGTLNYDFGTLDFIIQLLFSNYIDNRTSLLKLESEIDE